MLDTWHSTRADQVRLRRLTLGLVLGGAVMLAAGYGASRVQAAPPPPEEPDTEVEVALVETPEEPEPEPEPEPPPVVENDPTPPAPRRGPPPPPAPTSIPDGAAQSDDPFDGGGFPGDGPSGPSGPGGSGTGTAPAAPPPPPPPPPPPKPKAPPPPNPADYHPAKCKQKGMDASQVKAIGVEGRVVVKYTITATGAVTNVAAQSGPPELRALAVATVSAWTCQPARMKADDSAIQTTKNVPLTARLKTD